MDVDRVGPRCRYQLLGLGFAISFWVGSGLMGFAVQRIRHTQDSQGQILALAFMYKHLKRFEVFPPRSEAERHSNDEVWLKTGWMSMVSGRGVDISSWIGVYGL